MPKTAAVKRDSVSRKPPAQARTLRAENEELRRLLQEAEEMITAIRTGGVDALVIEQAEGPRIYTLESADRPYRLFVEEMQQGAATLDADGALNWCNQRLADLLKIPLAKLIGALLRDFITPDQRTVYDRLLEQGRTRSGRGEAQLRQSDGGLVPAFLTFNALPPACGAAIGVLVTDLTTQRHHEQLTAAHAALRASEERLAAELAATQRLQETSTLLIRGGDIDSLYEQILDAAIALMQSDMASLQMVDEAEDALRMLAFRGFDPAFGRLFELSRAEARTAY